MRKVILLGGPRHGEQPTNMIGKLHDFLSIPVDGKAQIYYLNELVLGTGERVEIYLHETKSLPIVARRGELPKPIIDF